MYDVLEKVRLSSAESSRLNCVHINIAGDMLRPLGVRPVEELAPNAHRYSETPAAKKKSAKRVK